MPHLIYLNINGETAMKLNDKVIIVTGSAQGIGEAIALRCAAEGGQVVLWDLRQDAIDTALARILGQVRGANVSGMPVDVSKLAAVQAAAEAVIARFGQIDGLVNNAGIVADAQLKNMSEDQWDRVININLKGVFNCTRACVNQFLAQGSGSIVSISSVVGVYGNFGQTNYAAAKAGVIGMTKTWAKELGRKGVRANAICPGFIETPILASIPQDVIDGMITHVPLRRMGQPAEIGSVAAFLLSEDASYVNGVALEVSGGLVL
jgi:3-oxoacyl-[acyl-carrier protein] reductase